MNRLRALAASVALIALLGLVPACGKRAPNATPEGAVRDFVERMDRFQGDPAEAKAAYALLSEATQANLKARAERYSAASGKSIQPEAMIAPAAFLLRFQPQRYTATLAGAQARVRVSGLLPEDRAEVSCVYEGDGWKLELALPPPPPIQTRPFND